MLPMAFLVATAPITPPNVAELNGATWADVELNAMIGNGNKLVSWNWIYGHDPDKPPEIRIENRRCKRRSDTFKCMFNFVRNPDPKSVSSQDADEPAMLKCSVLFSFGHDDNEPYWGVLHYAPNSQGGHSRTSLKCSKSHTKKST
jgi:hypothetical protein